MTDNDADGSERRCPECESDSIEPLGHVRRLRGGEVEAARRCGGCGERFHITLCPGTRI